jgi:hypothetical protein
MGSLMPLSVYPWGWSPHYLLDRRQGGPRARLYAMEKKKICCLCWELNPRNRAHGLLAILTELSKLLGLHFDMVLQLTHTCAQAHTDTPIHKCGSYVSILKRNTHHGHFISLLLYIHYKILKRLLMLQ